MKSLFSRPLDESFAGWWNSIDPAYKKAFPFVVGINVLAFGFEATNLTLHHDDVAQIFIQDDILGHYLGRFGLGKLHYYAQNAYLMPFLQMLEGLVLMSAYGMLVAHFWGVRKVMDIIFVASIPCVFPFMAQMYQYNTAMATYPMAHLLAALAVILSTRATVGHVAGAVLAYSAAFSIYQGVVANAATIFCVWVLGKWLFEKDDDRLFSNATVRSILAAILSVGLGGFIYAVIVLSFIDLSGESVHSAEKAFSISGAFNLSSAISEILSGTRAFFLWPENYFPAYLKNVQVAFLVLAAVTCIWLPKSLLAKGGAVAILGITLVAPRILQMLHPEGHYHNLSLTAYAVLIAGFVMIINRASPPLVRNLSSLLVVFLVAGYILQCNWISTVNYLNTLAHVTTWTQVLARVRSLPHEKWDGKTIVVVGKYDMRSGYPYKNATGVATEFLDAVHMRHLSRLMRDDATFVDADKTTPTALKYAATHEPWPHPSSVGIVGDIGVVILSKEKTIEH